MAPASASISPRAVAGPSGARRREIIWAYLLMMPTLLLVAGVLAYPVAWEIWVSLTNLSSRLEGPPRLIGLANYRVMLNDPFFWRGLGTTVLYFGITTIAKLALGIGMALLLARPFRGRALVFLAVFLPWAYPGGVSVIAWYWMMNPPITTSYAAVAGGMKGLGGGALGGGAYSFMSVALFNIWRGASFTAVFLLAGLNAIPTELFEYASLETRSVWRRFASVTLPLMRPYLALAV